MNQEITIDVLRQNIIKANLSFVGIKEDALLKPNAGFNNKRFEQDMKTVGWRPGMAWCNLMQELAWNMGYEMTYPYIIDEIKVRLNKLFSANSQACYLSFQDSEFETSQEPEPGDIGIYKKPGTIFGHTVGIESAKLPIIATIEGNSKDMVRQHDRKYTGFNGMKLMGFIKPRLF